ncbi:MAG: hypothetical protein ABIN48_15420 [Ginsengibacter sp.]
MHLPKSTRRTFLSTMAIFSAGAAFGSLPAIIFSEKETANLEKEWETFYKLLQGIPQGIPQNEELNQSYLQCKGHSYKQGKAIYFDKEGLLAIPTWIFWENQQQKPSDVYITFYIKMENSLEKVATYNRYELNAIYKTQEKMNGLNFIRNKTSEKFTVKTLIKNRSNNQHIRYTKEKEVVFEDNIIYNS